MYLKSDKLMTENKSVIDLQIYELLNYLYHFSINRNLLKKRQQNIIFIQIFINIYEF